jgi:hypothetical protein
MTFSTLIAAIESDNFDAYTGYLVPLSDSDNSVMPLSDSDNSTLKPTVKHVAHPVNARRDMTQPLPVHNERQIVAGMKADSKAVDTAKLNDVAPTKIKQTVSDLKAILKGFGLKVSGKKAELLARLERHATGTLLDGDKPRHRAASVKGKRHAHTCNGMTYRQAQRFVKFAKENLVGYEAPCKNCGWDNIEQNIEAILDNEHFWALMNNSDKHLASVIADCNANF